MAETIPILLPRRYRQMYHLDHRRGFWLPERISGLYRKIGHYAADRQVKKQDNFVFVVLSFLFVEKVRRKEFSRLLHIVLPPILRHSRDLFLNVFCTIFFKNFYFIFIFNFNSINISNFRFELFPMKKWKSQSSWECLLTSYPSTTSSHLIASSSLTTSSQLMTSLSSMTQVLHHAGAGVRYVYGRCPGRTCWYW